jgi:hypothetical protein
VGKSQRCSFLLFFFMALRTLPSTLVNHWWQPRVTASQLLCEAGRTGTLFLSYVYTDSSDDGATLRCRIVNTLCVHRCR